MSNKLKQRIIGAIVLISLAVIFIPMLLDGGGRNNNSFNNSIPPRPEQRFQPLEIELRVPARQAQAERHIIEQAEPGESPAPEAANSVQNEKLAPAAAGIASPQTAHRVSAPSAATVPGIQPPAAESQSWVVQVGSFSNSANALALRDRLREKGYTAFVEKLQMVEGASYRVRIGPESRRESAEQMLEKVKRELALSGIVMAYP